MYREYEIKRCGYGGQKLDRKEDRKLIFCCHLAMHEIWLIEAVQLHLIC